MPINVNLPARNKIVINETTYMLMLPRISLFLFFSFLVGGGGLYFHLMGFIWYLICTVTSVVINFWLIQ
jgi:hypothetical protein